MADVTRRGFLSLLRSQRAPAIIKPEPKLVMPDAPLVEAPTGNLPAVIPQEAIDAAGRGEGRAVDFLRQQLDEPALPGSRGALQTLIERAVNPEQTRRQFMQRTAGAAASHALGVSPLQLLRDSVRVPEIVTSLEPPAAAYHSLGKAMPGYDEIYERLLTHVNKVHGGENMAADDAFDKLHDGILDEDVNAFNLMRSLWQKDMERIADRIAKEHKLTPAQRAKIADEGLGMLPYHYDNHSTAEAMYDETPRSILRDWVHFDKPPQTAKDYLAGIDHPFNAPIAKDEAREAFLDGTGHLGQWENRLIDAMEEGFENYHDTTHWGPGALREYHGFPHNLEDWSPDHHAYLDDLTGYIEDNAYRKEFRRKILDFSEPQPAESGKKGGASEVGGYAEGGPVFARKAGQSIRGALSSLRDRLTPHVVLPSDDYKMVDQFDEPLRTSKELVKTYSSSPRMPRMQHPHDRNALAVLEAAKEDFGVGPGHDVPVWGRFYTAPVPPRTDAGRIANSLPNVEELQHLREPEQRALLGAITSAPSWADDSAMEILHAGSLVPGLGRQMLHEMRTMPHMKDKPIVLDMLDSPHTARFYHDMGFEPGGRLASGSEEYMRNLRLDPDEILSYKGPGIDWGYDWFMPHDKPFKRAEGGPVVKRFVKLPMHLRNFEREIGNKVFPDWLGYKRHEGEWNQRANMEADYTQTQREAFTKDALESRLHMPWEYGEVENPNAEGLAAIGADKSVKGALSYTRPATDRDSVVINTLGTMEPTVGRALVEELINRFPDAPMRVMPIEEARGFYGKMGFEPIEGRNTWKRDPQFADGGPVAAPQKMRGWKRYAKGGAVKLDVNTAPTEAQKEAGNYKKGHVAFHGMQFSIENPAGSTREGVGRDGKKWSVDLPAHYGYIRRTEGADGDHVDAYLGPKPHHPVVHIINQHDHETGKFDEHKVMVGYPSREDALKDYDAAFSDGKGPQRRKSVKTMHVSRFKEWLNTGDTTKAVA